MTPFHWSLLVWGIWTALVVGTFLALELPAVADDTPWNTLTWTLRQMFARSQLFGLVFVGLLAAFVAHLFWKRAKKNEVEGRHPPNQEDK